MLRVLKTLLCVALVAAGAPAAWAFSLLGPVNDATQAGVIWQVRDLGYNIGERGDIGAPKNLAEEYRRNIPIVYYSYDQNFLDFYGANGVAAVDQAFSVFNALAPVSSYSGDLSEIPLDTRRDNFRAGALSLLDLKSEVMSIMIEQLGLTDPIRYAWCLHDRNPSAGCPIGNEYLVTMRNFNIVPTDLNTIQYSASINGVLYSYYINEYCANPPFGSGLSEAITFPVDPVGLFSAQPVASLGTGFFTIGLQPGFFFTGLTRDDIAGLRYLYRAGNVNWESIPNSSVLFQTNNSAGNLSLLTTSNLTDLVSASLTNTDAQLQVLYPTLQIANTTPALQTIITTNQIAYFTNYPWNPVGVASLVVTNTYDTNVIFVFSRTFANVVTNYLNIPTGYVFPNNNVFANAQPLRTGALTTIQTSVGTASDPYGQPNTTVVVTNITSQTVQANMVMGDFFIIPTNACGFVLLSNVLTKVFTVTNTVVATNLVGTTTNASTSTNISFFSQTFLTYWTNHNIAYFPILCQTNETTLRRGIEKVTFVRRDFDSLIGQFFYPQTNNFLLTTVTNSRDNVEFYQRVAARPDFLFTAVDMNIGPQAPIRFRISARSINLNANNALPGLAGPGTIEPTTTITLNKSGPIFYNQYTNQFHTLDELTQAVEPTWASYDDSTNAPVLYPNGTSIQSLEDMILITLTTPTFPDAQVGQFYSTQLQAAGGAGGPFSFSFASNSSGLPPGLNLAFDGSGVIYGTPSADGTYDFIIRVTDTTTGRFSDWQVALTVDP